MYRGQKLATCVKQNYSAAVQINHLNRSPTSIQTKLNPDFSKTIETQSVNPSKAYKYQMKKMIAEDINDGMRDRTNSLKNMKVRQQAEKKDYRDRIDGVLGELQKNSMKHSLVLQGRMNRQEERKKLFIDEDKLKNSKISQFVEKREDKDVFNHESDLYQQYQKQEHTNSLTMLERQRGEKMQEIFRAQMAKQDEERNRLIFERDLYYQNVREKQERRERQMIYGTELGSMVKDKMVRDSLDRKIEESVVSKHNPITNPIEYHMQNPYILKRMQDRQRY